MIPSPRGPGRPPHIHTALGRWIYEQGYTVEGFARRMGISGRSLRRWVHGAGISPMCSRVIRACYPEAPLPLTGAIRPLPPRSPRGPAGP